MYRHRGGGIALGILGLTLIWKGLTGNVMTYTMGDDIIPRWMYIAGGLVLLAFPAFELFLLTNTGHNWWFGL